jgi:hypothetical protein
LDKISPTVVLPEAKYQNGNVEYVPVAGTESASSVIDGI